MRIFLILPFLYLFIEPAFATSVCGDLYEDAGAFTFQRFQGQTNCQVLATPANSGTDYYRAAVYTDEGMFMVFNSYEYDKGTDGARVFYFFPRTRLPSFQKQANGQMMVQTSAPGIFLFYDKVKTRFAGMIGGLLKEDPKVHPQNKGGIELMNVKTLWLDSGFKFKGDPTADPQRHSVFIDLAGKRCEVKNSEIFNFTADGDSNFKMTDAELKSFIRVRCPGLYVNW